MIEIKKKNGDVIYAVDADTLRGANLRGANLRDADLRGADLRAKQYVCQINGSRHTIVAIDDDVRIG